MAGFNLKDYETVKARKIRFYAQFPDGRITVRIINDDLMEKAVFEASVFKNADDQVRRCPRGVGFSLEIRDKEKSKNQYGKEYESVNYSSWTENAEESAVGRALDNAGFASNMKCSFEEIEKSERNKEALKPNPSSVKKDAIPAVKSVPATPVLLDKLPQESKSQIAPSEETQGGLGSAIVEKNPHENYIILAPSSYMGKTFKELGRQGVQEFFNKLRDLEGKQTLNATQKHDFQSAAKYLVWKKI